MDTLSRIFTSNHLHHAYLIEGAADSVLELTRAIEKYLEMPTRGNPDVHIREYDSFGIDDARAVQSLESKRAAAGERKVFILSMQGMTREAQNALLKTFEEPTAGTHFFVVVPHTNTFLSTLLSRVEVIRPLEKMGEGTVYAKQFLSASAPERLALIADVVESKDKQKALELVNELESQLYCISDFHHTSSIPTEAFEALQSVRSYLGDRSSSVKVLLEHLSVMLPQIT